MLRVGREHRLRQFELWHLQPKNIDHLSLTKTFCKKYIYESIFFERRNKNEMKTKLVGYALWI